MDRINFERWKRNVMPADFNLMQDYFETMIQNFCKKLVGGGIIEDGGVSISGNSLIVFPFIAVTKKGQIITSEENATVDVSSYISTGKLFSLTAIFSRKEDGSDTDIDNNTVVYAYLDSFTLTLKEGTASTFPTISEPEVLLRDLRFNTNGSVDVIVGRCSYLHPVETLITEESATERDEAILNSAKSYAEKIAAGSLSITALKNISFENLVESGNFLNAATGWTIANDAVSAVVTSESSDIFGSFFELTRTSSTKKVVATQIIDDSPVNGKTITLASRIKMEVGQNGGCAIRLCGCDSSGNVVIEALSDVVSDSDLTDVQAQLVITDAIAFVQVQLEINVNANSAYFSEIIAQYSSNTTCQYMSSPKDVAQKSKTYTDQKVQEMKAEILGGAGDAYDTLIELQEALKDDGDSIATLTSAVAAKASASALATEISDRKAADTAESAARTAYENANSANVSSLFTKIATEISDRKAADIGYIGGEYNESDLPVGSIVLVRAGKNEFFVLNSKHSGVIYACEKEYVTRTVDVTGTLLAGTWACRGCSWGDSDSNDILFQRIA